jgi:hypothetical protein
MIMRIKQGFKKVFGDVLVLCGCVFLLIGVWLVCPVAVWFVAGGMMIAGGILFERIAGTL